MIKSTVILILMSCANFGYAQKITPEAIQRAKTLVNQMTLIEKIDYIGGYKGFYIRAIPRLGIPEIRMADGPQGVRNNTKSTLYPCGIATTSTWNRQLMFKMGEGLGLDCRARGVNILLGPGVNIYRSPLCGRNFEYFGEDPYLASETAVQYINGVQSQNVIATIKHFAANNEEYDRHHVSSDIDKRTLNEVYTATFRKAVEQANVGAVMNSYNLVNGVHASENEYLNIDLLRKSWGFKGILMSDWVSVYSAVAPVNGGLDLEMPSGKYMNYDNLSKAIDNGLVSIETINQKAQNILQTIIAFGIFDHPQKDATIPEQNLYTENIALQIAREGIILLKNENNILPILKGKTLVTGPNTTSIPTGGGSGFVNPFTEISLYEGLGNLKNNKNFIFEVEPIVDNDLFKSGEFFTEKGSKINGFKAEYFKNEKLSGKSDFVTVDKNVNFDWLMEAPLSDFPVDRFSARWSGVFKPKVSGKYLLKVAGDDGYRLTFDGKEMFADWAQHNITVKEVIVMVEAGKEYPIILEYYEAVGGANIKLGYLHLKELNMDEKLKIAQNVILCVGFNSKLEKENADRPFELPARQLELIDKISKLNKNIIVIVNAGGGVEMASWKDKVQGIIMAWYPGQQGGQALAEIITGIISPSGKLPISIEQKAEDNPTFNSYYDSTKSVHKRVLYNEGVFLGYKGYDKSGIEPLFPFGFGLSYSNFEYSGLIIEKKAGNNIIVSFTVKNIGKYDAAEVVQIYVGDAVCSVPRPLKELKGFEKIMLNKGESKTLKVELNDESFSFFDVNSNKFMVEPGEFKISVGASSKDLRLSQKINL